MAQRELQKQQQEAAVKEEAKSGSSIGKFSMVCQNLFFLHVSAMKVGPSFKKVGEGNNDLMKDMTQPSPVK